MEEHWDSRGPTGAAAAVLEEQEVCGLTGVEERDGGKTKV